MNRKAAIKHTVRQTMAMAAKQRSMQRTTTTPAMAWPTTDRRLLSGTHETMITTGRCVAAQSVHSRTVRCLAGTASPLLVTRMVCRSLEMAKGNRDAVSPTPSTTDSICRGGRDGSAGTVLGRKAGKTFVGQCDFRNGKVDTLEAHTGGTENRRTNMSGCAMASVLPRSMKDLHCLCAATRPFIPGGTHRRRPWTSRQSAMLRRNTLAMERMAADGGGSPRDLGDQDSHPAVHTGGKGRPLSAQHANWTTACLTPILVQSAVFEFEFEFEKPAALTAPPPLALAGSRLWVTTGSPSTDCKDHGTCRHDTTIRM
ncbi:hypothetical protein CBR_g38684 [Chara braunii]|uniref:Uncharacterized protein n=1 Tax=Chara braunii TaxID=69332 RepID=A0A388LQC6_CHABU|nr:hypothetical protein CBR_g38684 [Chara braunii]|eukprot:GBG84402.1 hypothetical protein CBR_g38684 [Chara braunii]